MKESLKLVKNDSRFALVEPASFTKKPYIKIQADPFGEEISYIFFFFFFF